MSEIPFGPWILLAIFALVVGTTVAGALIAALSTRIIRGVAGLMICCMGIAGLYWFLNSPFLALMEILIYVGAVCVTIIFGVMLSETDEPPLLEDRRHTRLWGTIAVIIAGIIFVALAQLSLGGPWPEPAEQLTDGSVRAIGIALLTTYSLPFELISLVLLVAILGALVIARAGRTKE